jgi:outer membrane biosynthesis protein TonB
MRFRFEFLIVAVLAAMALNQASLSQKPVTPILVSASLPTYPPIWRAAHIQGNVVAFVTIKNGVVVGTKILSGENHLDVSTIANLKTWQFEDGVNATITVTYTYEILGEPTEERTNPEVEILPNLDVRITARPVRPTVNYGR